jgi:hypothetical protein
MRAAPKSSKFKVQGSTLKVLKPAMVHQEETPCGTAL